MECQEYDLENLDGHPFGPRRHVSSNGLGVNGRIRGSKQRLSLKRYSDVRGALAPTLSLQLHILDPSFRQRLKQLQQFMAVGKRP